MSRADSGLRRLPGFALGLFALGAGAFAASGGSLIPLWTAALAAGMAVASVRWGASRALAFSVIGLFATELGLLVLAPLTPVGSLVVDVAVWLTFCIACSAWLVVNAPTSSWVTVRRLWLALAAGSGAIILTMTFAIASMIPGSSKLAWGMNGDIPNILTIARGMVAAGGIPITEGPQPTPLPFAMIAANMAPGRGDLTAGILLTHDITRLQEVWLFAIALTCILAGAVAARFAGTLRLRLAIPAVGIVSCSCLTWYVIGVQFQQGFVSSAFALVLLIAGWLAYLGGDERPASALAVLMLSATALLATWAPLVIAVAALIAALVVLRGRRLATTRPRSLILGALAPLYFAGYAVLVVLPLFVSQSKFLGFDGGFPSIGPASVLVIAAVAALCAAVAARIVRLGFAAIGTLAIVGSFAVGVAYLLIQRLGTPNLWGYYPAKFAWTLSILLLIAAAGFAVAIMNARKPTTRWDAVIVATGVFVFGSLFWAPGSAQDPIKQLPLVGVVRGTSPGPTNEEVQRIVQLGGDDARHVLWRTSNGDAAVNYWLLQLDPAEGLDDPVRPYAYIPTTLSTEQICAVIDLLGPTVVVHTSDLQAAAAEIEAVCPQSVYRLETEPPAAAAG